MKRRTPRSALSKSPKGIYIPKGYDKFNRLELGDALDLNFRME